MPHRMEIENIQTLHAHVLRSKEQPWRRQCGCLKTSEKLRELLKTFPAAPPPFPAPPPPSPANEALLGDRPANPIDIKCSAFNGVPFAGDSHSRCISAYCLQKQPKERSAQPRLLDANESFRNNEVLEEEVKLKKSVHAKTWNMVADLVQLIQLSVTATALALYYLIYCYMQLVYYTLRSALYFHNADGPMKVTIGVVTITSVIVGFNLLLRMERLIGVTSV